MAHLKMSDLQTDRATALDQIVEELNSFVCENGPELLVSGMKQLEAYQAILSCLKTLKLERDTLISNIKSHVAPPLRDELLKSIINGRNFGGETSNPL